MMKAILTAGTYTKELDTTENNGNGRNIEINEKNTILSKQMLENEKVSIIFCHADIQGASMNDGMRCREGLDISAFPPNLPIYSGHFHKPHTVIVYLFFIIFLLYFLL